MTIKLSKVQISTDNHVSVDYAVNGWLIYIQRYFTPRTVIQYKMVLEHFCRFAPRYLSDIKKNNIEQYLDLLLKSFTPTTGNAHLTALKSFYRWSAGQFHCQNPTKGIKKFIELPPHQRVLSEQEYQAVLSVAKNMDHDIIQFLGNTGLRKSEFQSLTPQNFTPDLQLLWVLGKGRKKRAIPLNEICKKILIKYPPQNNMIPLVKKYQARECLYCLCCRLAKQADIPRFGSHALRHFFATRLVRAGVPLIKVSRILGHSSVQITEKIYVHLLPQDVLGVTDVLTY